MAQGGRGADRRAGVIRADGAARRAFDTWGGALVLFRLERDRGASGRPQSRLWAGGEAALVAVAAPVAWPRAGRLACPAGARLPGRAGPPHPRRARGISALGRRAARPFDVRPPG